MTEPEPYWREVEPPSSRPDLRKFLAPEAEPIWTLSFLLELPYSIRVAGARFLISAAADPWAGWNPEALGALAGMPRLPDGVRPTHGIEIEQARVSSAIPLQAVQRIFPKWEAGISERRERRRRRIVRARQRVFGRRDWKSVVRVEIFRSADEVLEEAGEEMLEWVSRRFDDALEIANEYLVILAGMTDEWHISSLSRIDLPPELPYMLKLDPGDYEISGSLNIHTWFADTYRRSVRSRRSRPPPPRSESTDAVCRRSSTGSSCISRPSTTSAPAATCNP